MARDTGGGKSKQKGPRFPILLTLSFSIHWRRYIYYYKEEEKKKKEEVDSTAVIMAATATAIGTGGSLSFLQAGCSYSQHLSLRPKVVRPQQYQPLIIEARTKTRRQDRTARHVRLRKKVFHSFSYLSTLTSSIFFFFLIQFRSLFYYLSPLNCLSNLSIICWTVLNCLKFRVRFLFFFQHLNAQL